VENRDDWPLFDPKLEEPKPDPRELWEDWPLFDPKLEPKPDPRELCED